MSDSKVSVKLLPAVIEIGIEGMDAGDLLPSLFPLGEGGQPHYPPGIRKAWAPTRGRIVIELGGGDSNSLRRYVALQIEAVLAELGTPHAYSSDEITFVVSNPSA